MKKTKNTSPQWRKQRMYAKSLFFALLLSTFFVSCGLSPVYNLNIEKDGFDNSSFEKPVIKVLNWNIEKKGDQENWGTDFARIVAGHTPDLLLFQEARLNGGMEELLGQYELGWNFAPNVHEDRHGTLSGVLTASQIRPLSRRVLLSEHHEPFAETPKISLVTEYGLSNREETLLVVNIHAINFVRSKKFAAQISQLETLLAGHQGPIILAGDFNTWSKKRMSSLVESAERLALKMVDFPGGERKEIKHVLFSPPFDHIFYRGLSIKAHSPDVLENFSSSDHKPLFVEFVLEDIEEPKA